MATGRTVSASSYPRYLLKMIRRFAPVAITAVNTESVTPSVESQKAVVLASVTVANNWVNGFVPFSILRYKVLGVLAKYGIPRGYAYAFMALVQHAYKQLVEKKNATVEEIVDRFTNEIYGSTTTQRNFLDITPEDFSNLVKDLLGLIGVTVA
jgi:hypothetical protein